MNSDTKQALARKWNGEEVCGCVTATIEGKRVVLGRTSPEGVFYLTDVGAYYESRSPDVTVSVLGADDPENVIEERVELNDVVEVSTTVPDKAKRGVRRPKVEQLEI